MFAELMLFLLFILFAWWLYRKFRVSGLQDSQWIGRNTAKTRLGGNPIVSNSPLGNTSEVDESEEATAHRAVSFEPDGRYKLGGKSSRASVQAYAAKIRRASAPASSPAVAVESQEYAPVESDTGADEWRNIASTDVVSDEEREFVASLLRQIDENNRDITSLSARVRDTDKLREQVDELKSALGAREQALAPLTTQRPPENSAIRENHIKLPLPEASNANDNSGRRAEKNQAEITQLKSRTQGLKQQLLLREQELTQLKSSLATAQLESREARQSAQEENHRNESERAQQKQTEQALAASRSELAKLGETLAIAEAKAASQEQNDLELRRVRSELQVLQQAQSASELQLGASEQRVVELEARLEGYVTGDDQNEKSSPVRTFASSAVANAAARAAARSTDPKPQTAMLRQLYESPEECDDLKLVKGIGLKMEQLLNQLGVTTFRQLASFEQKDIEDVSAALKAFPGRIQRDNWVGQAAKLQRQHYGDDISA